MIEQSNGPRFSTSVWLAVGASVFGCVLGGESAIPGIARTRGIVSTVEASEGVEVKSGYGPVHGLEV